jgi:hypothetical protein
MRNTIPAFLLAASASFFCLQLSAQQNYYQVKFPDDRTIISCGGTADTSDWPQITTYAYCGFSVGISVKDQVFNLNSTGTCKKVIRTWTLNWWCDYNPNWPGPTIVENPGNTDVGATFMANSVNHGYLRYAQIIKIVDNNAPVYLDCPDAKVTFCDYTTNDPAQYGSRCEGPFNLKMKVTDACSKSDLVISYRLYLDLDGNGSMETYRHSSEPNAWPIEKTISGDTVMAQIKQPAGVQLPYGIHKVEWVTSDRCGNESLCKYEFEIRDCKAPTVVCKNGLSVNIMPTGMITLWDTDFLHYTEDNCTPTPQLKIGMRKAGTGLGFPHDSHGVTFDCNEIGQQFVEIWSLDAWGNADFCTTYVIVQDNIGACTPGGPVSGTLLDELQQPLTGAKVLLKSNLAAVPQQSFQFSDADGKYLFASAPGTCNYSIVPSLDTLPALGLSTLDLILTDLHLAGISPLSSPYRIIAADVNRDGLLSQADVEAMGDLLVGNLASFPGNTSWRFVPKAFQFANPAQPLSPAFPEKISTTCPAPAGINQHFVAIKTGDVDASALSGNTREELKEKVQFRTPRQRFEAGEVLEVPILTPDLKNYYGFQFSIEANSDMLTLLGAEAGDLSPRMKVLTAENRVSLSWHDLSENEGPQTLVTLRFQAKTAGATSQALQISGSGLTAEVYDLDLNKWGASLYFERKLTAERGEDLAATFDRAQLFPVQPNPTAGPVTASFYLLQNETVALSLFDMSGRLVSAISQEFGKGSNQVSLPVAHAGTYVLKMQTGGGVMAQRVVVER